MDGGGAATVGVQRPLPVAAVAAAAAREPLLAQLTWLRPSLPDTLAARLVQGAAFLTLASDALLLVRTGGAEAARVAAPEVGAPLQLPLPSPRLGLAAAGERKGEGSAPPTRTGLSSSLPAGSRLRNSTIRDFTCSHSPGGRQGPGTRVNNREPSCWFAARGIAAPRAGSWVPSRLHAAASA